MKRSQINAWIREAESFFAAHGFRLPPWAFRTPAEWDQARMESEEIRRCGLGWDVTDFGSGDFLSVGLLLFTIRNGVPGDPSFRKPYAEKIMMVRENQVTPTHFHWSKMEDIINRGGGILVMRLWNADEHEAPKDTPVKIQVDGITRTLGAGERLELKPGESVCLEQRVYHTFRAERGTTMVGEVSMVNDDACDNRFLEPAGRFSPVAEDEPPYRILCNEYCSRN